MATTSGLTSDLQNVTLREGATVTADFKLKISPIKQEIVVTATGVEETAFESFQIVDSLDSFDLAEKGATAIGEVLENEPGVAKRSFGPGASRPIIRGFDGDRVLVLQDGVRTGSLASQSGDHGEPIDVLQLERLEVLKGPATLLYGSNAVGGVVNAVSGHHEMGATAHDGFRGFFTGIGGSANRHGGGGLGFEYGKNNWMFWASAGNQKTGDYKTPIGTIANSQTRISTGSAGFSISDTATFFSMSYQYDDGRYGVPSIESAEGEEHTEEEQHLADIDYIRRNLRLSGGLRDTGSFVNNVRASLNLSGWRHLELEKTSEETEAATTFKNKTYSFQTFFDQLHTGRLSGTFGVSGLHRDYTVFGEEALTPPVDQNIFSAFAMEEFDLEHWKLQFGGRVENTRYNAFGLPNRSFTGFSGSVGAHIPTWTGGAFVANFTHSHRAPAVEELYNNGPHLGNLTFEIGNPDLKRERSDGVDLSLRHIGNRTKLEGNLFVYHITDFVFLAPTDEEEDGLVVANYDQGGSRFFGTEISVDFGIHANLWVNGGIDYVNAELKDTNTPLPRIPPLRGRFGFDGRYKGLSVRPELAMAKDQNRIFPTETRTAGYTVVNLTASYTLPQQHFSHYFAMSVFNIGDRLYRNHVSFIKDIAPEIGRGVRATYSVKFF
ncbi:MAG: TonB-dependent receptor [Acidobacteria bacterium]|nr:TonB-dependent receptor [Acidobacteriota bacterium]